MVTANVRLLSPIGEGAMGEVWLAEHLTLETHVAVKFIHANVPANRDEAVARFRREAAVAAKIRSPHIVQVFDQGVMDEGTPYIVMELLEGESLEARLERVGRLTMRQTAQIVSQVAKGLRAAHKVGIVHRDIKPANIFLVPVEDGKLIKLVDFGIAKTLRMPESRKLTQDGLLIGTPEYICRDQIASASEANDQSDMWSLAVVAYECLVGEVPFGGSTVGMVCANVLMGKFAPPSQVRSDVPPDIDAWFSRCFDPEPAKRFASAREMALEFVRMLPRVTDIEADLLDTSGPRFSQPPSARGTTVGIATRSSAPRPKPRSLGDADAHALSGDSDWGAVAFEEEDSIDVASARGSRASAPRPSIPRPSGRPASRSTKPSMLRPEDASEPASDQRPSFVAPVVSPGSDPPPALPVRTMRLEIVGAAVAALAVAGVVMWFAVGRSDEEPSAPTVAAPNVPPAVEAPAAAPSASVLPAVMPSERVPVVVEPTPSATVTSAAGNAGIKGSSSSATGGASKGGTTKGGTSKGGATKADGDDDIGF